MTTNRNPEIRLKVELHVEGTTKAESDDAIGHVLRESSPFASFKPAPYRIRPGQYRITRREWAFFGDEVSTAGLGFLCIYMRLVKPLKP